MARVSNPKVPTTPSTIVPDSVTLAEAASIDLEQCYLCTKKHISRAQIFFEEYHTGYPDRIKRMIESLRVSEEEIRKAFLLYTKIQAQLDMAAGELLGNSSDKQAVEASHILVASKIRQERLNLQDNPLYIPDFDQLLVDVQLLQYAE